MFSYLLNQKKNPPEILVDPFHKFLDFLDQKTLSPLHQTINKKVSLAKKSQTQFFLHFWNKKKENEKIKQQKKREEKRWSQTFKKTWPHSAPSRSPNPDPLPISSPCFTSNDHPAVPDSKACVISFYAKIPALCPGFVSSWHRLCFVSSWHRCGFASSGIRLRCRTPRDSSSHDRRLLPLSLMCTPLLSPRSTSMASHRQPSLLTGAQHPQHPLPDADCCLLALSFPYLQRPCLPHWNPPLLYQANRSNCLLFCSDNA